VGLLYFYLGRISVIIPLVRCILCDKNYVTLNILIFIFVDFVVDSLNAFRTLSTVRKIAVLYSDILYFSYSCIVLYDRLCQK
jgi:hypothetical protein